MKSRKTASIDLETFLFPHKDVHAKWQRRTSVRESAGIPKTTERKLTSPKDV